jgi:hypothetical protein
MGRSLSACPMAGLFLLAGCDRSPEPGVTGGSFDPAGKRPGADGKDCTHGSTLGIFNQVGITLGPGSWNLIQNSVGLNLDSSGKGYEEHGPADSLTFNRASATVFGIGWSTGIEVVGH